MKNRIVFCACLFLVSPVALLAGGHEQTLDGMLCSGPPGDSSDCVPVHSVRELRKLEQEDARKGAEEAQPLGNLVYAFAQKILEEQMRPYRHTEGAPNRYFISVLGHDLPDRMLSELNQEYPGSSFLPGTAFNADAQSRSAREGTEYSFSRFRPVGRDKVEVTWGYWCGILCAGGYTSTFVRDHYGIWKLSDTTMHWVS